jgi:hypothetical protein
MAPALTTSRSDSIATSIPDVGDARVQSLLAANINPRTGLATDYLNHFNEAIMLLEMIPDMPECVEDFLDWQPRTYREHFEASNLKAQGLIIQAYEEAETALRVEFDRVIGAMTEILIAVSAAMRETTRDNTRAILAEQTTGWIKPLLSLAGGLIHGSPDQADIDRIMEK